MENNHQFTTKRSGKDRRSGWDRIDSSARRLLLLLGVAAAVGSAMTKLADAVIFGLVTPQRFRASVEKRLDELNRDIAFTRQLDSLRMVAHNTEIAPFVDSVRTAVKMLEVGVFLDCLRASQVQRQEYAIAKINCQEITKRFGVNLNGR